MIEPTADETAAVAPEGAALEVSPPPAAAVIARRGPIQRLHWVKRWMYRGGHPGMLARVMNRLSAVQFSAGVLSPSRAMTMEVVGRRSGRVVSFPVVVAELEGRRYLVSMLGQDANWVRNVRAAGGRAALVRHGRHEVRLVEVPAGERAPILRRYLQVAPGARPHLPVDRHAPLTDFERIAGDYPVFQVDPPAHSQAGSAGGRRGPVASRPGSPAHVRRA
jgi:deazaflavin-dependent oxidoreductase (nitroreductase family)